MECFTVLIFCAIASMANTITISPNGNSPDVKMLGGMMVDVQKGFVPMTTKSVATTTEQSNYEKSLKLNTNSTKLSLNERYRRLIPYMTFYYANDLLPPTTEAYDAKNVEVAQAEILEAKTQDQRQPKKLIYSSQRNIPRYQGNRLTQYNIASANPTSTYHKDIIPVYQNSAKFGNNPIQSDFNVLTNQDYERYIHKPVKSPSAPFSMPVRKPYLNLYPEDNAGNVQYYFSEKEQIPKYKLVPYEQTPPVKVVQQGEQHYYDAPKKPLPHSILFPKEQVFIKPRPRPQIYYENINNPLQVNYRKQPNIVSESYYEKRQPQHPLAQPVIEGGFKPIINRPLTDGPIFSVPETHLAHFENEKPQAVQVIDNEPLNQDPNYTPNYYKYVVEQPVYKPEPFTNSNTINLQHLISSLQLNKSIPKSITRENVGSSIRTLLQVLNTLKAAPQLNEVESPVLSTPQPFISSKVIVETSEKPPLISAGPVAAEDLHDEEPYLAPVNTPSQHLDDFGSSHGGTSQRFPQPINSDDEGGTPGRPGVDYPVLTVIPPTKFDCKTQRYKGFFADTETRCQVWHYCDLNGGQASFLCPNGTIFSQAGLTCDWWFNVKCDSTTQLYVLNESLYKYILPHSPKFPEDYSGPLVDKYLTLKFKEMEEQFRKNKNKQASEKMGSEEDKSEETEAATESSEDDKDGSTVSEASVVIQSPGTSGNVERLQD